MKLGLTTIVTLDYDEAIDFFVNTLGFELHKDVAITPEKRWVVVRPAQSDAGLLLAKATNTEQKAAVGNQTGGRVSFFLYVNHFDKTYAELQSRGVRFIESPRDESYGRVVVFLDLYGNKWDLLESKNPL